MPSSFTELHLHPVPEHPSQSTTLNKLVISLHDRWRRGMPPKRSASLAISLDLSVSTSTTLPLVFATDFSNRARSLHWKMPSSSTELYLYSVHLHHSLSNYINSLAVSLCNRFKHQGFCLTWMRPSSSTGPHTYCVPLAILRFNSQQSCHQPLNRIRGMCRPSDIWVREAIELHRASAALALSQPS